MNDGVAGHPPGRPGHGHLQERQVRPQGVREGFGVGGGVELVQPGAQLAGRVGLGEPGPHDGGRVGQRHAGRVAARKGFGPGGEGGLQRRSQHEVVGGAHQVLGGAHEGALDQHASQQEVGELLATQAGQARPEPDRGGARVLRLQAGDALDGAHHGGVRAALAAPSRGVPERVSRRPRRASRDAATVVARGSRSCRARVARLRACVVRARPVMIAPASYPPADDP